MVSKKRLIKELSRKLTVMLIPHDTIAPMRISFPFSMLLLFFAVWTGVTLWAGYISSRHVDYWATKAHNRLMKDRVAYFAEEVKQTREMADQIKGVDKEIRTLLGMKTKDAIVQENVGSGGPESSDEETLDLALTNRMGEMTETDMQDQVERLSKESHEQMASFREITEYVERERALYRATPLNWPAMGRLSSHFGLRNSPFTGAPERHAGLDIANKRGTAIHATADGVVRLAGWEGGYGRLVVVDHGFGYSTRYGHTSQLLVKVGDKVKRGQVIAYMGSTGSSTGDHVHYEVLKYGKAINPLNFMKRKGSS